MWLLAWKLRLGVGCLALLAAACSASDHQNSGDALADADIVRCDMPSDLACREYDRGVQGDATAFVSLSDARSSCSHGWPGLSGKAGTFEAGACGTNDVLARCRTTTSTTPALVTIDYFYTGFADTASKDDPVAPLRTLCAAVQSNAAQAGVNVTSVIELPPF
jgi:hypothetical protein